MVNNNRSNRSTVNIQQLKLEFNITEHHGALSCLPLHSAAVANDVATIGKLVASGKHDVNQQDDEGWTPLHYAAYRYPSSSFPFRVLCITQSRFTQR